MFQLQHEESTVRAMAKRELITKEVIMEDSQKKQIDPERESLIQEMLRDAKKTDLSSSLDKEPVIHRGDAELPAPMVRSKITSAGYVFVYDTRTFQKAPVLYYMLPQILRTRRQDGSYRWTVNDPGKEPRRGQFKCQLHKDNPNRAHYDTLGFRVCPKDNLANPYEVRRHMQLKHKAEWAAIEEARKEQERQDDRKLQQLMVETVAGKTIKPVEEVKKTAFVCDVCGADFGAQVILDKHKATHK